jgi:hypothetical protein
MEAGDRIAALLFAGGRITATPFYIDNVTVIDDAPAR